MTDEERERLWVIADAAVGLALIANRVKEERATPADLEAAWDRLKEQLQENRWKAKP